MEKFVQLDSSVGCCARLILGGVIAQPEKDIMAQLVVSDLVRVEHDVAVAIVELAVFLLGPGNNLEVFNTPIVKASRVAYIVGVPGWLRYCRVVLDLMVHVGANELDIAVVDVVFFQMNKACVGSHVVK